MDNAQSKQFVKTAKELDADDDEATFKRKLGVIAKAKAKNPAPKKV